MSVFNTITKRRWGVTLNYALLLLTLALSIEGNWFGWSTATTIGFWIAIVLVAATFFPVHIKTGLWRLVHAKADTLDEREVQQTLQTMRYAYAIFSVAALLVILSMVFLDLNRQTELLVVFWVLYYLAHTLPSSILAWTSARVPAQAEE